MTHNRIVNLHSLHRLCESFSEFHLLDKRRMFLLGNVTLQIESLLWNPCEIALRGHPGWPH